MEPDVDALATQQDVVDLSRPMVLGRVTRDGRDMLMLRFPDGRIEYAPAELMSGAEVTSPVTETAAETLIAGREVLEEPLPSPPPPAEAPMSDAELAARVAELEGAAPTQATDAEQLADESFLDRLPDALQYLDLAQLAQAPRYRFDPPGILRGRGGSGAQALQRLGIASLV
jgi:hypothetical protein